MTYSRIISADMPRIPNNERQQPEFLLAMAKRNCFVMLVGMETYLTILDVWQGRSA
jgi:hypothetical protein